MFTGLVEAIGTLHRRAGRGGAARARIRTDLRPLVLGESIAVDGACLTVDAIVEGGFEADVSTETLARTTLGALPAGARVHLERATPLGGRMGGHTVLGHVDGVGRVMRADRLGDTVRLSVRAPGELAAFVAPKGSIAVNGVSLTVNGVEDAAGAVVFDVMLVPHTLSQTTLGELAAGSAVNLEVDVLARYVARALEVGARHDPAVTPRKGAATPRSEETEHAGDDQDQRILAKLRAGGFA